jgi:hypothetical protein
MTNAKVSGLLGVAALVISANGCGEAEDPTETVTGAIVNQWTGWFSEELPSAAACYAYSDQSAVMGIACSGSYCDSMKLYCGPIPAGFTEYMGGTEWNDTSISEEKPNNLQYCPPGSFIYGMAATGRYSDNIQLLCRFMHFPPQGVSCKWTPWVSEEQGTLYFDPEPYKPGRGVAIAVMCMGSYCDSMQFLACEAQCTSHADCGVNACVNGSCVIP